MRTSRAWIRNWLNWRSARKDAALLASIFRTIHTIKGTCGFFAFSTLERITHQAETLLSQLRDGKRELTPSLISLILETVDATRKVLASIEASGEEGPDHFEDLDRTPAPRGAIAVGCRKSAHPGLAVRSAARNRRARKTPPRRPKSRKPKRTASKSSAVADANIRVGVGLLDKLMDLVGELVLTRNQILQFNTEREDAALNATSQRLNLITTELQEGVMKTRMQPIGMVWNKLPRVVRDMAVALGKQIRLEMDGADTELDRTIIEAIKDPLVHLVRNSCDHGIEPPEVRVRAGKPPQGRLTLRAYHEGGQVNIEIGDDGAGIDVARVKQKAVEKGPSAARTGGEAERSRGAEPDLPARLLDGANGDQRLRPRRRHGRGEVQHREDRRRRRYFQPARRGHHGQAQDPSHPGHHSRPGDHQRRRALRHSPGQSA